MKNPLNGTDLVKIEYSTVTGRYDLTITVKDDNNNETAPQIKENIKNLNKNSMSSIMEEALNKYYEDKTDANKQLLLFGASILKSLGDLVCYITVNIQEFLISDLEQQQNDMYLCNSADYSMYYPMLGNFILNKMNSENNNNMEYDLIEKYQKSNMYLSCSVKEKQNFFVPFTKNEQTKLHLVKSMYINDSDKFELIKIVLSFGEKYGRPNSFNNKTIYNLVQEGDKENLI